MRTLLLICTAFVSFSLQAVEELETLPFQLPKPVFIGTHVPPKGVKLDPAAKKVRPPFIAVKGLTNLANEKSVTASDKEPVIGELKQITDADKEGAGGSYTELGPGVQWVQVDLGAQREIHAILFWLFHGEEGIFHDVIVQIADDADFITNVTTLFNNDFDNSAGMGVGNDFEYYESNEGKLVDARKDGKPTKARYVRVFSNGSTLNEMNRFTELEVWGRPLNGGK